MTVPAADYTATLPRKRMGSAALSRDCDGRILLVEPMYKDYWELPGGAVDGDESPYDAVARELKKELGLALTPGRLLVVDWVPPRAGRTEGVMFVYDGGVLDATTTDSIHLPIEELRSWAWPSLSEAQQRLSPLLARRAAPQWRRWSVGSPFTSKTATGSSEFLEAKSLAGRLWPGSRGRALIRRRWRATPVGVRLRSSRSGTPHEADAARAVQAVVDTVGVQQAGQVRAGLRHWAGVPEAGRAQQRCEVGHGLLSGVDAAGLADAGGEVGVRMAGCGQPACGDRRE